MLLLSVMATLAAPGTTQLSDANFFTKTRSDGVTVLCVRHEKRPSILSSKVQCNTVAGWRAAARDSAMNTHPRNVEAEVQVTTGSTALGPR